MLDDKPALITQLREIADSLGVTAVPMIHLRGKDRGKLNGKWGWYHTDYPDEGMGHNRCRTEWEALCHGISICEPE